MRPSLRIFALLMAACSCMAGRAQDDTDDFGSDFESFRRSIRKDFDDFRRRCNEEYAAFLKNPWAEFKEKKALPRPADDKVPPVVCPPEEGNNRPAPRPIEYDEVVPAPQPEPQPQPVEPIRSRPVPARQPQTAFTTFGTAMQVAFDKDAALRLSGTGEEDISRTWSAMSANEAYSRLVADCLNLRRSHNLCDWAYLAMLRDMAAAVCGSGTDEATMLMAYVFCQSGYRMRLARDASSRLHLLYASRHQIHGATYFVVDGESYYPYGPCPSQLNISSCAFPKEQSLSLLIPSSPRLTPVAASPRTLTSERYPEVKAQVAVNKNLIDFYDTYPTSVVGGDIMSRWAMYANTPMAADVQEQLYPTLRKAINGCGQREAADRLLNWVQTAFVYEYDDKVWGHDRAFFAEESLHYPYCDCEDRSILFTRLVRDLLGLRCILIYYPGHLASAVELTDGSTPGDYLVLSGRHFTIADATYIGAPMGRTMPGMDNATAKVILLE